MGAADNFAKFMGHETDGVMEARRARIRSRYSQALFSHIDRADPPSAKGPYPAALVFCLMPS